MDTEVIVGDIVTLNIGMAELPDDILVEEMEFDDYSAYFEGMILEIDEETERIEVAFHRIEDGQISSWFQKSKVKSIDREYKVLDLVENYGIDGSNPTLIAELSRIQKTFHKTEESLSYNKHFSMVQSDTFLLPLDSNLAEFLLNFPEDNILLKINDFRKGNAEFDGVERDVYHLDNLNTTFEQVFD